MASRLPAGAPTGRKLVEPPGYFVASFLSAAAIVGGIGLAPVGLLLFAAAAILSVIEWRRLRAANPWLKLETPEDLRSPEGEVFTRFFAMGTGMNLALATGALVLVLKEGDEAAAIGPALIAGVVTIANNYLLKLRLAKVGSGDGPPLDDLRDGDEDSAPFRAQGDAEQPDDEGPGFAGHAPPLEQPRKGRRETGASRPGRTPREPKRAVAPAPGPPSSEPHETAPHDGDPDDGFVDQDDRALNGPRIEPPHRSKSRRGRPDKDDRRY